MNCNPRKHSTYRQIRDEWWYQIIITICMVFLWCCIRGRVLWITDFLLEMFLWEFFINYDSYIVHVMYVCNYFFEIFRDKQQQHLRHYYYEPLLVVDLSSKILPAFAWEKATKKQKTLEARVFTNKRDFNFVLFKLFYKIEITDMRWRVICPNDNENNASTILSHPLRGVSCTSYLDVNYFQCNGLFHTYSMIKCSYSIQLEIKI